MLNISIITATVYESMRHGDGNNSQVKNIVKIHTVACHAAQEASTLHHGYLQEDKTHECNS